MKMINIEAPETGAKLAVMYRFGMMPDLFKTKEQTIDIINKYPVLVSSLSEEHLKDREIILAYIKANLAYIDKYIALRQALYDCTDEEDDSIRRDIQSIKKNANIDNVGAFWFEYHSYDEEIVSLLINDRMWKCVHYTNDTYNETQILKMMEQYPDLIYPFFDYLSERLAKDPKAATSAKEKYNTSNDENYSYLAFRKCIDAVSKLKNAKELYLRLLTLAFDLDYDAKYASGNNFIEQCFRLLNQEMRHNICKEFYYVAQYLSASEIDDAFATHIIEQCPIAANLLPDEQVLKNNLKVKISDAQNECRKCNKCIFRRVRFV